MRSDLLYKDREVLAIVVGDVAKKIRLCARDDAAIKWAIRKLMRQYHRCVATCMGVQPKLLSCREREAAERSELQAGTGSE